MKSKIYMKEVLKNKDRKSAAAPEYYPARIKGVNGEMTTALFTMNDLLDAVDRANKNKEDIPKITLLERIFG